MLINSKKRNFKFKQLIMYGSEVWLSRIILSYMHVLRICIMTSVILRREMKLV